MEFETTTFKKTEPNLTRKKIEIGKDELSLNHQLNVLKTIYEQNSQLKISEEMVLKKRELNEFLEEKIIIKHSSLKELSRPIDLLFPTEQVQRETTIELADSFKDTLKLIISNLPNFGLNDEFIQISRILLKLDKKSFEFLAESVILNINANPAKLEFVNQWLIDLHRYDSENYPLIFDMVVGKMRLLKLSEFSKDASKYWDDFTMVC